MSCLTKSQEETVERVYNSFGGSAPRILIRLFVKLSAPARTSVRLALTQMKSSLQAQVNSVVIRQFRAEMLEQKLSTTFSQVSSLLNQSKNTLNLVNTGVCAAEDFDDPAIQKFFRTLTGLNVPKLPAINFGGFDTINATVESINYELNRVRNAIDLSQDGLKILNEKLRVLDEYITILDAI